MRGSVVLSLTLPLPVSCRRHVGLRPTVFVLGVLWCLSEVETGREEYSIYFINIINFSSDNIFPQGNNIKNHNTKHPPWMRISWTPIRANRRKWRLQDSINIFWSVSSFKDIFMKCSKSGYFEGIELQQLAVNMHFLCGFGARARFPQCAGRGSLDTKYNPHTALPPACDVRDHQTPGTGPQTLGTNNWRYFLALFSSDIWIEIHCFFLARFPVNFSMYFLLFAFFWFFHPDPSFPGHSRLLQVFLIRM